MSGRVADKLVARIREQIEKFHLRDFSLLFHGGEPLLWGIERFDKFVTALQESTSCQFRFGITTNGVLITSDWAQFFRDHRFSVSVSLDGPQKTHDRQRKTFAGTGTYDAVISGIKTLKRFGVKTTVLAVCSPESSPDAIVRHFVEDLQIGRFDILIPQANHDKPPKISIAPFYIRLFDIWLEDQQKDEVDIRISRAHAVGVLGGITHLESIGYGLQQTTAVLTDGSLEPLDVLRFAHTGHTQTKVDIFSHGIQDVVSDPFWEMIYQHSKDLPVVCEKCEYRDACGGGYMPHRFSSVTGYDNPSVYCEDLKAIFRHVWDQLVKRVAIRSGDRSHSLEAIAEMSLVENTSSRANAR